jgi:hypothetical protein
LNDFYTNLVLFDYLNHMWDLRVTLSCHMWWLFTDWFIKINTDLELLSSGHLRSFDKQKYIFEVIELIAREVHVSRWRTLTTLSTSSKNKTEHVGLAIRTADRLIGTTTIYQFLTTNQSPLKDIHPKRRWTFKHVLPLL